MKFFKELFLILGFLGLNASAFAIGSANGQLIHYENQPGSSFILKNGTTSLVAGSNQRLGTTIKQCPSTFIPTVNTSINTTEAPNNNCPITSIHAADPTAQDNGAGGYNVMIRHVEVDNTGGSCTMPGLTLNWTVFCMPSQAA